MSSWWHAFGFSVLLATPSCRSEPDLPPRRFETEHFLYHARPEIEICDGLGDWLEHHYHAVGGALGASLAPGEKIDIYVFSDLEDLSRSACPPEAFGCARGRAIYQSVPFVPHELIHAYTSLIGRPPILFDEALARVLGCGPGVTSAPVAPAPAALRAGLTSDAVRRLDAGAREAAYAAGAAFVRYLIDRFGLERSVSFYAALDRDAEEERILREFSTAFELELDAALVAWASTPARSESSLCLHLAECAAAELPAAGAAALTPACVFGVAADGFLPVAAIRKLSLREPSGIIVRSEAGILALLKGCDAELEPGRSAWFSEHGAGQSEELWTDLEPGEYWFMAGALAGGAQEFEVEVEVSPPLFADRCAESSARSVDAGARALHVFGSLSGAADDDPLDTLPDLAVGLELAEARLARMLPYEGEPWLCAAGCPSEHPACDGRSISAELPAGATSRVLVQGSDGRFGLQIQLEP